MIRPVLTILALLMVPLLAQASWYEASGSATIDGDLETARQAAINDAVRNALLFAGMELHSSQQVENGILTNDQLSWASNASVANVRLVDETRSGNRLTVNIHAELRAVASDCRKPRASRKRISVGQLPLVDPQHALQGGLYHLGEDNRQELLRQITRFAADRVTISDDPDAPYRLTAKITDATLLDDYAPQWQLWAEPPKRALRLTVSLVHRHTGEPVLNQEYGGSARWPFAKTEQVDSGSSRYWQSPYGSLNRTLLEQAARDLNHALACKPLYGQVVSVQGQRLWLDVGINDGITPGFALNLYKTRQFLEADGQVRSVLLANPRAVKVAGVDGGRSYIDFANAADASGYQAGDQVIEP